MAEVEVMIHMAVETARTVIPRAGADKDAAVEPFRSIEAIGGTVERRNFVVAVGTDRRSGDAY
jgi:hypothetical protein